MPRGVVKRELLDKVDEKDTLKVWSGEKKKSPLLKQKERQERSPSRFQDVETLHVPMMREIRV